MSKCLSLYEYKNKVADELEKKQRIKGFLIWLIRKNKLSDLYCEDFKQKIEIEYCVFQHEKAWAEYEIEFEKLQAIDIKNHPTEYIKQHEIESRKYKRVNHWWDKYQTAYNDMTLKIHDTEVTS
jgi:hypothetical protein